MSHNHFEGRESFFFSFQHEGTSTSWLPSRPTVGAPWPKTKGMVARLVAALGRPFPFDPALRAFPSPEAISEAGEDFLAEEVRLGYRAPYVAELARRVAAGELDLEVWKRAGLSTPSSGAGSRP